MAKVGSQTQGSRFREMNEHPQGQLTGVTQHKFWNKELELNVEDNRIDAHRIGSEWINAMADEQMHEWMNGKMDTSLWWAALRKFFWNKDSVQLISWRMLKRTCWSSQGNSAVVFLYSVPHLVLLGKTQSGQFLTLMEAEILSSLTWRGLLASSHQMTYRSRIERAERDSWQASLAEGTAAKDRQLPLVTTLLSGMRHTSERGSGQERRGQSAPGLL